MASHEEIQSIIGKATMDVEFRANLLEDPVKAILDCGYELTQEQTAQLQSVDKAELDNMLTNLDERLSKATPSSVVSFISVGWP